MARNAAESVVVRFYATRCESSVCALISSVNGLEDTASISDLGSRIADLGGGSRFSTEILRVAQDDTSLHLGSRNWDLGFGRSQLETRNSELGLEELVVFDRDPSLRSG